MRKSQICGIIIKLEMYFRNTYREGIESARMRTTAGACLYSDAPVKCKYKQPRAARLYQFWVVFNAFEIARETYRDNREIDNLFDVSISCDLRLIAAVYRAVRVPRCRPIDLCTRGISTGRGPISNRWPTNIPNSRSTRLP